MFAVCRVTHFVYVNKVNLLNLCGTVHLQTSKGQEGLERCHHCDDIVLPLYKKRYL